MTATSRTEHRSNRRQERRVPFNVEVTWYGGEKPSLRAVDLSLGGMCVSGAALDPGTCLEIGFGVPGYDLEVFAEAMVEWVNDPSQRGFDPKRPSGMGLMFVDIDPEQRRVLEMYMRDQHSRVPDETIEDLIRDELQNPPPGPNRRPSQTSSLDVDSILESIASAKPGAPAQAAPPKVAAAQAAPAKAGTPHDTPTLEHAVVSEPEVTAAATPAKVAAAPQRRPTDPKAVAAKEQAAREQAAREQAAREQAAREQAAREQAAREQAAREQAAREQAAREQAAREQAQREQAARELAMLEQASREQAALDQAAREQAAKEQAARAALEEAAREQAAREQAAREQAAREQAAREQAAREQAAHEQAAHEQAAHEQETQDQLARQTPAPEPSGAAPDSAELQPWFRGDEAAASAASEVDAQHERLAPGTVLGTFRIVKWLGSGGMGDVYQAVHVSIGRDVAIKLLRNEIAHNRQALRRFFEEARSVNRIRHENIVEITDFVSSGPHTFCVMEFLDGPTLADLMRGRALPLAQVLRVGVQVSSALKAVHTAGIIHRDLKPQNIMLIERGGSDTFVKLLDFGIAKLKELEDGTHKTKVSGSVGTTTGSLLLGTPAYMAPEQFLGNPVDHRADVYAFGVILYEMITGVNPFAVDTWGQAVVKHVTEPPPPPGRYTTSDQAPDVLQDLIVHCLAKKPEDRPQHIAEVAQQLTQWEKILESGGRFPKPKNRSREESAPTPKRGRSALRFVLVAGLLATAAAGAVIFAPAGLRQRALDGLRQTLAEAAATPETAAAPAAPTPTAAAPTPVGAVPPEAETAAAGPEQEPAQQEDADDGAQGRGRGKKGAKASRGQRGGNDDRVAAAPVTKAPPARAPTAAPVAAASPQPAPAAAKPPKEESAPAPAENTHYEEAKELLRANKTLLAIEALERSIGDNPRHAPSYLLMGKAYAAMGREQKAVDAFEKFVKLAPNHKDAEKLRGIIAAYKNQ